MYIWSFHYNREEWGKVAVCMYHHSIITWKDKEKLRYVYIITSLYQGRMKKSCSMYVSSLLYNKEEWRKVAVCIYHHFIITRKNEEKLRYVYIICSLQHGRMRKSCAFTFYHFFVVGKDQVEIWYVDINTSL